MKKQHIGTNETIQGNINYIYWLYYRRRIGIEEEIKRFKKCRPSPNSIKKEETQEYIKKRIVFWEEQLEFHNEDMKIYHGRNMPDTSAYDYIDATMDKLNE